MKTLQHGAPVAWENCSNVSWTDKGIVLPLYTGREIRSVYNVQLRE